MLTLLSVIEFSDFERLIRTKDVADIRININHRKAGYVHFLSTIIRLTPDSFDQLAEKIFSRITNDLESMRQKLL